jgi:predicted nucleotide-binding protein
MTTPAYEIFISVPRDERLSPNQCAIKQRVIEMVEGAGFKPLILGELGSIANDAWTFDRIDEIMRRCQGVIILGLNRWEMRLSDTHIIRFLTEFSHYEGGVAYTLKLPMLLIREATVVDRGVLYTGGGKNIVFMPDSVDVNWINSNAFLQPFNAWSKEVNDRYHLFLGYSGNARSTAVEVKSFLETLDVRVMDWQTDFKPGKAVLERIREAEQRCKGGIFLFMKDDTVVSNGQQIDAPRDNVVFEAGYFMNTKGSERTLLICEQGVKILSDLRGVLYLELEARNNIAAIQYALREFIEDNF